jgi:hypothetical protein
VNSSKGGQATSCPAKNAGLRPHQERGTSRSVCGGGPCDRPVLMVCKSRQIGHNGWVWKPGLLAFTQFRNLRKAHDGRAE